MRSLYMHMASFKVLSLVLSQLLASSANYMRTQSLIISQVLASLANYILRCNTVSSNFSGVGVVGERHA